MKFSLDRLAELFAEEFSSADMEMDQGIQEDCAQWAHNAAEMPRNTSSRMKTRSGRPSAAGSNPGTPPLHSPVRMRRLYTPETDRSSAKP